MGTMTMKSTRKVLGLSFDRSHCSFACSALLASLARSAVLIRLLARSLAHGKAVFVIEINVSISYNFNSLCQDDKEK